MARGHTTSAERLVVNGSTGGLQESDTHPRISQREHEQNCRLPAIRALVKTAVARSEVPFNPRQRSRLVIKSISKKQRPRRPL